MSDMTDEERERREVSMQRALDNPMPRELEEAVSDEIVPHCLNAYLKRGEVMLAIEIAYPLIRDYLRAHPEVPQPEGEVLKTPREWAREKSMWIRSPDGWRRDGKSFDEPITEQEFNRRAGSSTVER